MQVKHLIALLSNLDPESYLVLSEQREETAGHITEMRAEYLKKCTIWYPHLDRAPRFAKPDTPAERRLPGVFIGTLVPK